MDILGALKQEEAKLHQQLTRIQGAIAALNGATKKAFGGGGSSGNVQSTRRKRVMSAAVRAKLSRKAKERWARIRAEKNKKSK
jgi:hypothetical protein